MYCAVIGRRCGKLIFQEAASKRESPMAEELQRELEAAMAAATDGGTDEETAPVKKLKFEGGGFVPCKGRGPGHLIPWYTSGFQ